MIYRKLGRTGFSVSEIGLGCEHLQGKDYAEVEAVVNEAVEQGVNILDVFMSEPQVRTDIGKAILGKRGQLVLQGHIGAIWRDGQYARSRDVQECRTFFEDLLTRLQTDYIDIGMIHFVDTDEDYDAVFNSDMLTYARGLKEKGVIRALGMSSHNAVVAKRAVDTGLIDVLMFSTNPAYDLMPPETVVDDLFATDMLKKNEPNGADPARAALYAACEQAGCGITVMKAFCGGMLLNGDISPFGTALAPYACIHYALSRPAVASALIGCRTPEEVRYAAAYEQAESSDKDFSGVFTLTPKYAARGRCVYCNHCLPCPARIEIAQVNKYLDLASGGTLATVAEHYNALSAHGSDCMACGQCEPNCPFGVDIRARMEKAAEVFGK